MNKKFGIMFVIIVIASLTFVSAESNDSIRSDLDYSYADSLILYKDWIGDNSSIRPDSITVRVFADGELLETVTINQSNNWLYDSGRILFPLNNTDGSKVKYTFEEVGVDNYTFNYTENGELNFTLTNTLTNQKNPDNLINNTSNNTTSKNPIKEHFKNNTAKSPVKHTSKTSANKDTPHKKTPVNHNKENNSSKMLNSGNNILTIVVCVIVIAVAVIYSKR